MEMGGCYNFPSGRRSIRHCNKEQGHQLQQGRLRSSGSILELGYE